MDKRKKTYHNDQTGGVLAELAFSLALLITILGGAIDMTLQTIRYGELIEIARTTTRLASSMKVDPEDTAWLEEAGNVAVANANVYLTEKGFNPEDFQIQFTAEPHALSMTSSSAALVTITLQRKGSLLMLPSEYLFESCVKSTYLWEEGGALSSDYTHNVEVAPSCA